MNSSLIKTKRKVSCMYCRLKKVRCDGNLPCSRCVKKDCGDQCTYTKQRPLGRPPKNSVVNKLILSGTKQQSSACRDFIIENLAYTIPAGNKFLHNDKTKNLLYFIDTYFTDVFCTAVTQLAIVRGTTTVTIACTDIKMYDLIESHTWTATELVNIFVSKTSSLPLDEAHDYNDVAGSVFKELAFKFFDEGPMEPPVVNPLANMPTQQAVRLIECFFCVHPNSIMLNKTLLFQAFWLDAIDPLLLCVIYGTTMYFSKLLEGKPVHLWEAVDHHQRNPFLDYAYYLLQKSSSAATLVKYQAIVLLGLFEGLYGLPKRGMALLGLAYMVSAQLGVLDGSLLSTEVSDVEAELVSCAFWTNFNHTVRGSLDVGQAAHFTKDIVPPPLPPTNIDKSLSYQLEKSSGNQRLFRSYYYLVETFYIASVLSKYVNKMLQCFPEVKYNLTCNGRNVKSRPKPGFPTVDGLLGRLRGVLDEFDGFIKDNRHEWSPQQVFTIETSWRLLDIHHFFIMDFDPPKEGTGYTNSVFDIFKPTFLSGTDDKTMARVRLVLPKVFVMVDALQLFLSDPKNYNNNSALLPRSLIVSILETATTVLCLEHRSNSQQAAMAWDYLNQTLDVANNTFWTNWTMILAVRNRINYYKTQVATMEGGVDVVAYSGQHDRSMVVIPSPQIFSVDDDLALAAFLDPCSSWLAPMANLLPLDKMLSENTMDGNNVDSVFVPAATPLSDLSSSLPLFEGGELAGIMGNSLSVDQEVEFNPMASPFTTTTTSTAAVLTPTLSYANDNSGNLLSVPPHPYYPSPQQHHCPSPIPPLDASMQNLLFSDNSFF